MISKSPYIYQHLKDRLLKKLKKQSVSSEEKINVTAMINYYESRSERKSRLEQDIEWQKNNLEYDLRSTDWILKKVRTSNSYSQNLYAALCNRQFQKLELISILKDQYWSCSWRYAGGIIADMRQEGNYMDWYCSGIRNIDYDENINCRWNEKNYVEEGFVTEEIKLDLQHLGWIVLDNEEFDN